MPRRCRGCARRSRRRTTSAATCARLFCHDRRSLRSHHGPALVRAGSALEEAARRAGAGVRAPAMRALDLACGTGDIAFASRARGARVVGLDLTLRMVELAARKPHRAIRARASRRRHDGAAVRRRISSTSSRRGYGIRNVPSIAPALARSSRMLRPGGLFLSLDFNRPSSRCVRVRLPGLSDGRRIDAWIRAASAIPTRIATFPNRSAAIPAPSGCAGSRARTVSQSASDAACSAG